MLSTTDAIVLSLQPHSDKAHILHAYTRNGGRTNYYVYGLGRKHSIGMYMPLSLLQITADHPSLQNTVGTKPPTLKEASPLSLGEAVFPPRGLNAQPSISETVYQQTIRLFIAEVLFHVLRHPMPDEPMFDFLQSAIQQLNTLSAEEGEGQREISNFHLLFLVQFAAKLGFAIPEASSTAQRLPVTRTERQQQLRALCAYFAEHVETWEEPKSLDVLMEVFD